MPLLGKYRFSFDTWKILEVDDQPIEESEEIGNPDIETGNWRPIDGKGKRNISVIFVDGVRRTENLVYIEDEEIGISEGAFVSIGAGALLMNYGKTNPASESYLDFRIRRFFFIRKGIDLSGSISFSFGESKLEFFVESTDKEISPFVNEVMAKMESDVAESVYRKVKPTLMLTDGTVHYSAKVKELPFIGYIKKHKRLYIPHERMGILRELRLGQRTPLVLIHSQPTMEGSGVKSFDKLTWYVKISEHEGISGIARLEVPIGIGVKKAKELADLTAWLIPKFASTEFAENRAPHNLLPIKHLENALRKRLGSQTLIRRIIMNELLTAR